MSKLYFYLKEKCQNKTSVHYCRRLTNIGNNNRVSKLYFQLKLEWQNKTSAYCYHRLLKMVKNNRVSKLYRYSKCQTKTAAFELSFSFYSKCQSTILGPLLATPSNLHIYSHGTGPVKKHTECVLIQIKVKNNIRVDKKIDSKGQTISPVGGLSSQHGIFFETGLLNKKLKNSRYKEYNELMQATSHNNKAYTISYVQITGKTIVVNYYAVKRQQPQNLSEVTKDGGPPLSLRTYGRG